MSATVSRRDFVWASVFAMFAGHGLARSTDKMPDLPVNLDHMLLGISDLDRGIRWLEQRTGVRPIPGGVHPGRGTRNALLALGGRRYLEIIAPDPAQPAASNPMVNGLRIMEEPRLIGWAVHLEDLNNIEQRARTAGIATDARRSGSRARPDGKLLRWQALNLKEDFGGVLPFFIEWSAESPHPSQDAPAGCSLQNFYVQSPAASDVSRIVRELGLDVEVRPGTTPVLHARITGKDSALELN